jgi:hypothetical protein
MNDVNRREFLAAGVGGVWAANLLGNRARADSTGGGALLTRGVVLVPEDLTLSDWPQLAKDAGLTTIGLHHQNSPAAVVKCVQSQAGGRFREECRKLGLQIEYELHAMQELLPRNLFEKAPDFFRMNDNGERTADVNCCVHSDRALEIVCENALAIAKILRPTTGRYFYWGDDGQPWCLCPKCRDLSPSDQATLLENRICRALREEDPRAQVAHLAYLNTLPPPEEVKPDEGVFLEYAPIKRRYDIPYEEHEAQEASGLHALEANLRVFPGDTAQVLEYWLDVSRFSRWKRPGVKIPWNREVCVADIRTYRKLGIRHITTFAAWIDAGYRDRFEDLSFITEYGEALAGR